MKFDWDDDKNVENKRKHGLSFELAAEVFDDPFYVVIEDQTVQGEQRFWALADSKIWS